MLEINFKNQLQKLVTKICTLYPHIDREKYLNYALEMTIVENDDITDKRIVSYHQPTNTLRINKEELEKGTYDLEYYMTLTLLTMQQPYFEELEGLRYGYNAGIASMLVGNTIRETAEDIEPGIDIYESLRDCIAALSTRIGHDKTIEICSAKTPEMFNSMFKDFGLDSPESFLDQMNYLYNNAGNITNERLNEVVDYIKKICGSIELGTAKKF